MKRPLALFSLAFLCASAVVSRFAGPSAALTAGIVSGTAFAAVYIVGIFRAGSVWMSRAAVFTAGLFIAFCIGSYRVARASAFTEAYAARTVNAEMTVTDCERLDINYYRISARLDRVEGERASYDVVFYSRDGVLAYDRITARAEFVPGTSRALSANIEDGFTVVGRGPALMRLFARIRDKIGVALRFGVGGEEGALCATMTLGDKSLISRDTMSDFYRSGASHILVVSGLHLSVILGAVMRLVCLVPMPRWVRYPIMLFACAFIVLTVGFSPSVLRAGIMAAVAYLAYMNRESADGLTSLMFAALIIVAADQRAVTELSFLLSFACTFALIVVVPSVSRGISAKRKSPLRGFWRRLLHAVLTSVCVWAACVPVLLLFGRPISLVGTLANLLVLWIMTPALILCLLTSAAYWLFGGVITAVLAFLTRAAAWYISAACRLVAAIPFAVLDGSQSWLKVYAVCVLAMFAAAWLLYRKKLPWLRISFCCVLILLAGFSARLIVNSGSRRITVVSGSTLSVVLYGDDGGIACVDDGTADALAEYALAHRLNAPYIVTPEGEDGYCREVFADSLALCDGYSDVPYGSFTAPLAGGEAEFFVREGRCEYIAARIEGRTVLITLDCGYLPADLSGCELLIITRDAPADVSRYRGEIISRADVPGAERPEYGDYFEIYIRPQGRIRVQS